MGVLNRSLLALLEKSCRLTNEVGGTLVESLSTTLRPEQFVALFSFLENEKKASGVSLDTIVSQVVDIFGSKQFKEPTTDIEELQEWLRKLCPVFKQTRQSLFFFFLPPPTLSITIPKNTKDTPTH